MKTQAITRLILALSLWMFVMGEVQAKYEWIDDAALCDWAKIKKTRSYVFEVGKRGIACEGVADTNVGQLEQGHNDVFIATKNGLEGYHDILNDTDAGSIYLSGDLYLPRKCTATQKYPAVIIQHGSGSPNSDWYPRLAKALNAEKIIALVPNSHSARGIQGTSSDQTQLSKAGRLYDTFAAFRLLQDLPCVDPDRVGLTGYSFGGTISIDSVESTMASKLGNGHIYKATLPVYPDCQSSFETTKPTNTKVHMLLGGADDYTPASYCLDRISRMQDAGWDVTTTVYEGAHHGFISSNPPRQYNGWTFKDCGVGVITDEGYEVSEKYGVNTKDGWAKAVETLVKECAKQGITYGGSWELSNRTLKDTVDYFKSNL